MSNTPYSPILKLENYLTGRFQVLSWALLLAATIVGIWLRVDTYLLNMPMWTDTVRLAVNVVERDYLGLLRELYGDQSAPPGFMMLSRFVGSFFNFSEPSLYAVTLAFSILGLLSFLYLSIYVLGVKIAPVSYLPMAFSASAVFYAGTFKQYSCELFFCTLILICCFRILREGFTNRLVLLYVITGIVGPWFSLGAIIFLAGTGLVLVHRAFIFRDQHHLPLILGAGLLVFLHFIALYLYQIRPAMPELMENYWSNNFTPSEVTLLDQVSWWGNRWYGFFLYPSGFTEFSAGIAIAACLAGIWSLLRNSAGRATAGALLLPLLILCILVSVGKYPFTTGDGIHDSRLTFFLVPTAYLLVAIGLGKLTSMVTARSTLLIVALVALSGPPLHQAITNPYVRYHDMRSLHAYLMDRYQPGDNIYADFRSVHAFRYYNRNAKLPYSGGTKTKSTAWYWDMDTIIKSGERTWIAIAVGKGGRSRSYTSYLGQHYAPVSIKKFRGAWLLVSDPAGNPVLD